jgi:hypothetical protein
VIDCRYSREAALSAPHTAGETSSSLPAASRAGFPRSSLDDRGLTEYLSSQLGEVETTLHDASAALGHDIEIHAESNGLRDFFEMVRPGADGWDGSEPLRPVGS